MNKTTIEEILRKSIIDLRTNDMELIEIDNESEIMESIPGRNELERKLHEVCINHRLAVYLEKYIHEIDPSFFIDIEYNRYYKNEKYVDTEYYRGNIRPDIIVHKRIARLENQHLLVIEAKKDILSSVDESKVKALMIDPKYNYKFGARIRYRNIRNIKIDLYYKENGNINNSVLTIAST